MEAEGPSTPTVIGQIDLDDGAYEIDLDRWVALAERALGREGVQGPAELALHFVGPAHMAELNVGHMGGSGPTDVLAFPLDAYPEPGDAGMPRLLGDIVVCPAVAQQNASQQGGTLNDELALLVVHGILHILGHDHAEPEETRVMKAREAELLEAFHQPEAAR